MSATVGDRVTASVTVRLPRERTFDLFTRQIDLWWRRGPRFRQGEGERAIIHIEPVIDGRVLESWHDGASEKAFEIGRITRWEPPRALAFTWRNANFAPHDITLVEVLFEEVADVTMVTVTHGGWSSIREDHPARHGLPVVAFQHMIGTWWGEQLSSLRRLAAS